MTANWALGRAPGKIKFDFDIYPQIGWGGDDTAQQYATGGFLASFPLLEPHYQVLISKGKAMGHLTVTKKEDGRTVTLDLDDATMYLEKNWDLSFPPKWW